MDQTCQQTVPCLAHCLYWSISIVPALGLWLCQLLSMNNLSSTLLLLLETLNNHWPCQSCWAEPQELPNGLGLEPPFPNAAEMRFQKHWTQERKRVGPFYSFSLSQSGFTGLYYHKKIAKESLCSNNPKYATHEWLIWLCRQTQSHRAPQQDFKMLMSK